MLAISILHGYFPLLRSKAKGCVFSMVEINFSYINETLLSRSIKVDRNLHTEVDIHNSSFLAATFRCLYKQTFRKSVLECISFEIDISFTSYTEYHS